MDHAWLDSLSEDWVSQPASDNSDPQLPLTKSDEASPKPKQLSMLSRIPRRTPGRSSLPPSNDPSVLSERSANDINMSMNRLPSRLSQEVKHEDALSRTVSGETEGSVVHNTMHKSQLVEDQADTPEWKRRLLQGDMQYGEQRDLFHSAAEGLTGMFQPPAPAPEEDWVADEQEPHLPSSMPSSPPVFGQRRPSIELAAEVDQLEDEDDDPAYHNDVTPSPSPRRFDRDVGFRLNVEDTSIMDTPSNIPAQRQASSRPGDVEIYRDESCLSAVSAAVDQTRKTSGQSDTRNEDFSPIIIGKHSDESGKVDFAPLELPADKLKQKLEMLRQNQVMWNTDGVLPSPIPEEHDVSRNMEPSEEYACNGGYINFRRGGRSADGSFRHRALSPPSFNVDSSEMLPEESLQASTPKQFPSVTTGMANTYRNMEEPPSPSLPRAPFPSPEKRPIRDELSGGSPLKLFGPYDTFTNQTLLRRISQFEEGTSGNTSRQSGEDYLDGTADGHKAMFPGSPLRHRQVSRPKSQDFSRSPSEFGSAEFEGYQFNANLSYETDRGLPSSHGKENRPPIPYLRPPGNDWLDREGSPEVEPVAIGRRKRDKTLSSSTHKHTRTVSSSHSLRKSYGPAFTSPAGISTPKRDSGSEGKRPRTSPSKDPTPKRRRTLHRSDIAFGRESLAGVALAAQQVQSLSRPQSRQPSGFELASPNILAQRAVLRPRTPSEKLQQYREQLEDHRRTAARRSPLRDGGDDSAYSDGLPVEVERKPSIRTQDFVDQAAHIMAMIRNQVRPTGLDSVDESRVASEQPSPQYSDGLGSESTNEPLSRPPSREGRPALSRVPHQQEDPELLDRLRKYQESSEVGDVISSSMRSLGLARSAIRAAEEASQEEFDQGRGSLGGPFAADEGEMISDIPNVRITTNPLSNGPPESPSRDFPSHSSTARSYPTGSSRGSDSKRVIMPDSVSHLIPERVGSMQLDKNNNIWVKNKDERIPSNSYLPSDSEDDPFASIPDLSVDLTKEMQNLRLTAAKKGNAKFSPEQKEQPASPSAARHPRRGFVTLSPNGSAIRAMTSPARDEIEKLQDSELGSDADGSEEPDLPPVTHNDKDPVAQAKRRNITISFSSPVASFIQDVLPSDIDSLEDDEPSPELDKPLAPASPSRTATAGKSALKKNGHGRGNSRQEFFPRPVSRIDEQDEDSTVELPHHDTQLSAIGDHSVVSHKTPNSRRASSLSFMLQRTPGAGALSLRGDENVLIGQNVGKLSLSPLSEFTVNKSEESFGFEVSYVMGHRRMETGDGSRKVMSMTIRELVDKLSEVEPYEPYWEDLVELDLSEKRLSSLHMLDEFCNKIVTLDASKNALGHLDGVPMGVRHLKASNNLLTELTSWDHLMNLQYVDVSANEIKSLSALKNLVHLRSIKADNNQLTSLEGLDCHDGLLTLRARGNQIEYLDFAALNLPRLTDLDVAGNQIKSVRNLDLAPELSRLRLSRNQLETFSVENAVKGLRLLDLSDNRLHALDISNLPGLHSLHADRNYFVELRGFSRARRLDSLSLREQRGDTQLNLDFLSEAYEVRKLFLSGNYLGTFEPRVDFLNLQLLELANCGLQALPEDLGQLMPNLRVLNVNFNAIANLSPLRYIPRLKKLLAAGNRLGDSTSVTELLTDFPHLTELDLRDNPVTLGFYAPLQALVSQREDGVADPFVLPEADAERDETYSKRLDETTKQRRRLHQIVFVASCKRLRILDGLAVKRKDVLAKDAMLEALIGEGLLPNGDEGGKEARRQAKVDQQPNLGLEKKFQADSLRSSRWNAEDSFA